MNKILEKAIKTASLNEEEIIFLLKNNEINSELFNCANMLREKIVGNEVHLRGLLEISNICSRSCKYCGLRCENKKIDRYKLTIEEIISSAKKAKSYGFNTVVLQSGESNCYKTEEIVKIIKEIKKMDLALTLSLGEKTFEEYKAYKEAGADRYLLKIETTDKKLYQSLHPKMSFENRLECLSNIKKLNYEVGSGIIIGINGETIEGYAKDLLFLQKLPVDMAGIGPFVPNEDTPLKDEKGGDFTLSLKIMAILRLLLPKINIPATTAMETINKNGYILALTSGANVIMPNVTDLNYRKKYIIYPNKVITNLSAKENYELIKSKIESINRTVSNSKGVSLAYKKRIKD